MFDLAPHGSYAFLARTLITLIAAFGVIGSTSLVVIAQGATPAVPDTTGSEQTTVDVGEPIADTTSNADTSDQTIDQSGGGATEDESATLPNGIVVAPPTATDIALSCTPQSVSKAAGEVQTVNCIYSAEPTLRARSVALDSIAFTVPPGWILTNPSNGTLDGNTLNFSPAPTISTSQSHDVSFDVTPSCTASTAGASLNLTSSFTAYGTSIPGPEQSIDLTRSAGKAVISVGFADTAPFAFGNATVSGVSGDIVAGSAAITVDRAACSEGSVSIQISSEQGTDFDPAAAETGTIPLQNISVSDVTVMSGDAYISTSTPGGPITSASIVANVTAGDTASQYQVALGLLLDVPAGTPSGTYKATLIVDVVSDGEPG